MENLIYYTNVDARESAIDGFIPNPFQLATNLDIVKSDKYHIDYYFPVVFVVRNVMPGMYERAMKELEPEGLGSKMSRFSNNALYKWSKKTYQTKKFTSLIYEACSKVEEIINIPTDYFNIAGVNYYKNGNQSLPAHSDHDGNLEWPYCIATFSWGASRTFGFDPFNLAVTNKRIMVTLNDGDMLWMGSEVQRVWKHLLFKETTIKQPRISLTLKRSTSKIV